jgi:hypothetical protein
MALNLVDIPASGGGWFKPTEEAKEYPAFLIEVLDFEAQRPGTYGPKDSVLVNMTIFADDEALDAGEPTEVKNGMRIEYTVLTRDLKSLVGGATIVTLAQVPPSKPGQQPAWVWRQAGAAAKKKVSAYVDSLNAAIEAAIANAPSFD